MPRPLRKTAVTSLKMTPEVRDLWEQCAASEDRSLTNMFEVLVRAHAKKLGISSTPTIVPSTLPPRANGTRAHLAKKK